MRDVDDGRKRGRERIKSKKPHFHVSAFDLADTSVHIHGEPTRAAASLHDPTDHDFVGEDFDVVIAPFARSRIDCRRLR